MKYKIGIFGSSLNSKPESDAKEKGRQIGAALGEHADQVIVVTGGCSGVPYAGAHEAAKHGVEVWGYSPMLSMEEQREFTPDDDINIYTKLLFVDKNLASLDTKRKRMKYRNVLSTADCDAGIIISGQWGSLNEFTNLVDMQKLVGVLTGSGGIADELPALCKKINKEGQGEVIFDADPKALVEKLLAKLTTQLLPEQRGPDSTQRQLPIARHLRPQLCIL